MSYLTKVINDILEIIVSKLDYKSYINLLSLSGVINVLNLNYNHILKLKYPELVQKEKMNISSYIEILIQYNKNVSTIQSINYTNYEYIIYNIGYVYRLITDLEKLNNTIKDITEDAYGFYEEENMESMPKIIFIKDHDFYNEQGYNTKYINKNLTDDEKNILPSIKKLLGIDGGIICFKKGDVDTWDIDRILRDMNYSVCLANPYEIKTFTTFSGLKVLYLKYEYGNVYQL